MIDAELNYQRGWRFCSIPAGQKGPRTPGWQNNALQLSQIPQHNNIGLLLGPHSGGIAAVDFDGPWGWQFWDEHIGCSIPHTVAWSSGREGRCQMALTIPTEAWDIICTHKASSDGQGFEFRWSGTQSVLPPSTHPTTGLPYFWVNPPSTTPIAEAPVELLEWVITNSRVSDDVVPAIEPDINNVGEADFDFVHALLGHIKSRHPVLDYDLWIRVCWATAAVVGRLAAAELLREFWGEQQRGEYNRLLRGYNASRSPKIGTLITLSGLTTDQWRILKLECELTATTRRIA